MEIEVVVGQALFIEQTVESNIKGLTLDHRLAFTEAVGQNLNSRQLSSFLQVRQLVFVAKTIALSLEQTVAPIQSVVPRGYDLVVDQQCFVWDEAVREAFWPLVEQTVGLSQTVEVEVAKAVYETVVLTETLEVAITRNLVIEQTFSPVTGVIGFLPSKYWHSFEIEVIAS